jgi:glycosyltransferase involved in cell wall biosynthesis
VTSGRGRPGGRRGVLIDLVAAQSPSYRGRGIARYATDLAKAMVTRYPDLVSAVAIHPELEPPAGTEDLSDWVTAQPDWESIAAVHLCSVFEPEVPVRLFWPRQASASRAWLAVTVYDLIPDIFPDWYLEDPGLRRRWRCGREVVRVADAVVVPSEATKRDTVDLLGVPAGRISVIGSGTSSIFRPPESRATALAVAQKGVKGLKPGFIVYNGAFNPRKNIDRLLEAYAALPRQLTRKHQLVIFCEVAPLTRNHYLVMAEHLGVKGRLLLPGFVPEEVMLALFQSAELAVFPSLYEGYGLPVVDSMACGAPTIAGDNSSLREILPAEARFDASDTSAITAALRRALTDEDYRSYLLSLTRHDPPSWDTVADKLAPVYEQLLRRSRRFRPGWRRHPRLALVGAPRELALACEVRAEVDEVAPGAPLRRLDAWRGGYDAIVVWADAHPASSPELMEELAANFAGRAIALTGQPGGGRERALVPQGGVRVMAVEGDWQQTARDLVGSLG